MIMISTYYYIYIYNIFTQIFIGVIHMYIYNCAYASELENVYVYIYIIYIYTHSNISTMNRFKRHVYIVYMAQVSEVADMPQNQPGRPPDLRSPYYNCYLGHSLCL